MLCIAAGSVVYHRVAVPRGFGERLRGMRRHRGAMLFSSSSVHGIGMDRPLDVVAIASDWSVLAVNRLRPGTVLRVKGARRLLEIEVHLPRPAVGAAVSTYDPCDGGTTRDLCHAHREPGRRQRETRRDAPFG
ncbi:MAG TPA: hypothetical protein VLB67_11890 [Acidimicrobiia bacterium]|nr:hypothetical protein [Acidimicrobiia bacterium]